MSGTGRAASFAAFAAKRIPPRPMMLVVGTVIVVLSLRGLVRAFA